jgi:hypothetical protein
VQELRGKPYCKWHNSFTHNTKDCNVFRRQVQMAIEQGQLLLEKSKTRIDASPFPGVNMVEMANYLQPQKSAQRRLEFAAPINIVGPARRYDQKKRGASPSDRPRKDERCYITEDKVRSIRYQRPLSTHLLHKYEYQYQQRRQRESEEEEYERRAGRTL